MQGWGQIRGEARDTSSFILGDMLQASLWRVLLAAGLDWSFLVGFPG